MGVKTIIKFTVYGKPQGKARPRFNGRTRTTYTPKSTKDYEAAVKAAFSRAKCVPVSGEISARITAFYAIPQSTRKSKREAMERGEVRPTVKPDLDNVIKAILDALNGLAYADDSAVVAVTAQKRYSECPRVEVEIFGGEGDG